MAAALVWQVQILVWYDPHVSSENKKNITKCGACVQTLFVRWFPDASKFQDIWKGLGN